MRVRPLPCRWQDVVVGGKNGSAVRLLSTSRSTILPSTLATQQVWALQVVDPSPGEQVSVCAVDVDGDGRVDVIAATGRLASALMWYRNGGGAPLVWTPFVVDGGAVLVSAVAAADLDQDGRLDIVAMDVLDSAVVWYRSSGSPPSTWTKREIFTLLQPARFQLTDLDGVCILRVCVWGWGRGVTLGDRLRFFMHPLRDWLSLSA
jgi:hypothetical protein